MLNLVANGPSGYNLTNSLRFRSSANAYLNRTPASAGNQKTWTWSGWVKRGALSTKMSLFGADPSSTNDGAIYLLSTDVLQVQLWDSAVICDLQTTQVFRDPSAWYHIVVAWDTTQATASNRVKVYINGVQVTAFGTATYPSLNYNGAINKVGSTYIGVGDNALYPFDGYMTEINFIDGQALTPSSFGSTNATTGVWQPAKYTGTYGTNGFYLPFTDNSALTTSSNVGLGKDFSGNSNYWVTNNISITAGTTYDSMKDVPTLTSATVANYATLNPLDTSGKTISNANLTFANTASAGVVKSTIGMSSGKWYCEYVMTSGSDGMVGICLQSASNTMSYLGSTADGWCYRTDASRYNNGTRSAPYGATWTVNDIIGIAFDADTGSLTFYKNGTSQGVAYSSLAAGTYVFAGGQNTTFTGNFNFGQRPFTYTPPTGYVALNTYNLPTSTIVQGNKYMDATLYTGNGSNPRSITNSASFYPDLVWVKDRTTANWNILSDSVRGANNVLYSNSTAAQQINEANGYISAFNSNGFSVTNGATSNINTNTNGDAYVAWQWQAGQGSTSSNTNGSITSTVSVNASAGFSVVTYTGTGTANQTVGHGLGVAPAMVIIKGRGNAFGWATWHKSLGTAAGTYLALNTTAASATDTTMWQPANNSSTVISVSGSASASSWTNAATTYVAYCWAEIAGFSKFGSFTSNASADGTFVYLGFRPKYIMFKPSSYAGEQWYIQDSSRSPSNVATAGLYANLSIAEDVGTAVDLLSNGFKLRVANGINANSGATVIYAAFAESPFRNSLAR